VFDDADLDNAVSWSIRAIFSNAGQVCLAGSRLYVQRGIYAEFTERFVAAAKALVAGDPKDEATQLGPLASEQHYPQGPVLPGRHRGRRRHDQDRRPRRRLDGAAHRGGERPARRARLP
jgi:acyl-CoA reductase-like NAD-dependent aldehyde dehydrogenase